MRACSSETKQITNFETINRTFKNNKLIMEKNNSFNRGNFQILYAIKSYAFVFCHHGFLSNYNMRAIGII